MRIINSFGHLFPKNHNLLFNVWRYLRNHDSCDLPSPMCEEHSQIYPIRERPRLFYNSDEFDMPIRFYYLAYITLMSSYFYTYL